jgi:hypothetical protein
MCQGVGDYENITLANRVMTRGKVGLSFILSPNFC